jgi:hypothetical protein
VLPLDVYLENEIELVKAVTTGEVTDGLEGTVGAKLLKRDPESKVVVNFHGVSFIFYLCLMFYLVSGFLWSLYSAVFRVCRFSFLVVYQKPQAHVRCQATLYIRISLIHPTERRPRRPRPPPLNLPLHLRHPTRPPPNLRLQGLRSLQPDQRPLHPHRNRLNHRLHLASLLHPNHPRPPDLSHRTPRPKPRHRRNRRERPLLRRPDFHIPPLRPRTPIPQTLYPRILRRNHPRRALHRPPHAPAVL